MEEAHERQADELEQQADFLEKGGDSVGDQIKDLKEDWEGKKSGTDAPGAMDHADAAPGGLGEEEEEQEGDEESDEEADEDDDSG